MQTSYTKGIMSFHGWTQADEGLYLNDQYPHFQIQDNDTELVHPQYRSKDFTVYDLINNNQATLPTFEQAEQFITTQSTEQ